MARKASYAWRLKDSGMLSNDNFFCCGLTTTLINCGRKTTWVAWEALLKAPAGLQVQGKTAGRRYNTGIVSWQAGGRDEA
jgi:hypothetical protein